MFTGSLQKTQHDFFAHVRHAVRDHSCLRALQHITQHEGRIKRGAAGRGGDGVDGGRGSHHGMVTMVWSPRSRSAAGTEQTAQRGGHRAPPGGSAAARDAPGDAGCVLCEHASDTLCRHSYAYLKVLKKMHKKILGRYDGSADAPPSSSEPGLAISPRRLTKSGFPRSRSGSPWGRCRHDIPAARLDKLALLLY